METLAEKRSRIKAQRKTAEWLKGKLWDAGYAAGVHVRKGAVILKAAKAQGNGIVVKWTADGITEVKFYGDEVTNYIPPTTRKALIAIANDEDFQFTDADFKE